MDLVINHRQVKKERKSGLENICEVILYETQDEIHFQSEFSFDYRRFGKRKKLLISHGFHLKLKNGNRVILKVFFNITRFPFKIKEWRL